MLSADNLVLLNYKLLVVYNTKASTVLLAAGSVLPETCVEKEKKSLQFVIT